MVAGPLIRGLLGIEPLDNGTRLRIAPQLPADWNRASARGFECGGRRFDLEVTRGAGLLTMRVARRQQQAEASVPVTLTLAPAFPLDARITSVVVNGRPARPSMTRIGDVQFAEVAVQDPAAQIVAQFRYEGGSDVYVRTPVPATGARSEGIRILRSRADDGALARRGPGEAGLRLLVEGRGGRSYDLYLRTTRQVAGVRGATLVPQAGGDPIVRVAFEGAGEEYGRREVVVEFRR
jgi:hypothetical protein